MGGDPASQGLDVTVDSYAPNEWRREPNLPKAHPNNAVAAGADGRLYVLDRAGQTTFMPAGGGMPGRWSSITNLKATRVRDAMAAALGADGRIYAIGGGSGPVPWVDAYLPASGTWSEVAPLSGPRQNLGAARGADGLLYAVGGDDGSRSSLIVEAYGPLIDVSPKRARIGDRIAIQGSNFAPAAQVRMHLDGARCWVVLGMTDGNGRLAPAISFPLLGVVQAGKIAIEVVDDRSQYPVKTWVTVVGG